MLSNDDLKTLRVKTAMLEEDYERLNLEFQRDYSPIQDGPWKETTFAVLCEVANSESGDLWDNFIASTTVLDRDSILRSLLIKNAPGRSFAKTEVAFTRVSLIVGACDLHSKRGSTNLIDTRERECFLSELV